MSTNVSFYLSYDPKILWNRVLMHENAKIVQYIRNGIMGAKV